MRERQREGEAERGGAGEALCFLWPPSALEGTGEEGGEAAKRRDPAFVSYLPPGEGEVGMRGPPRPGQDFLTAVPCDMKGAGNTKS